MSEKMFDFCIGNPPYQGEADNNGRKPPVYNVFMDAAYDVATAVELITPAGFLFDAGQTSSSWNQKMLNDDHFKVLLYEPNAEKIFSNTEIKGGVAITYRDETKNFGKIGIFTSNAILNGILHKVLSNGKKMLNSIAAAQGFYKFDECVFDKYPEILDVTGKGTKSKITSKIIDLLPKVFLNEKPSEASLSLLGRANNHRVNKYILKQFVSDNEFIDVYNVALPKASGAGLFGETLAVPFILNPGEITSDTFVSIGKFKEKEEAEKLASYLRTKFLRTLLGVAKVTQDVTPDKFRYVPLQDFSTESDIDWSKSIPEIDRQLYKKYDLSKEEIDFIEKNVKEMV